MCLSKAFIKTNGNKELLMEDVASVGIEGDKLVLKTIFGERREIEADIREIDFTRHSLVLENVKKG